MGFIDRIAALARGGGAGGERSPREDEYISLLQEGLGSDAERRFNLLFSGNVQGVGFRWTNKGIAGELGLAGWVVNLPDGNVEMEVQGPCGALIRHIDSVHARYDRMGCRVWLERFREERAAPDTDDFTVRY